MKRNIWAAIAASIAVLFLNVNQPSRVLAVDASNGLTFGYLWATYYDHLHDEDGNLHVPDSGQVFLEVAIRLTNGSHGTVSVNPKHFVLGTNRQRLIRAETWKADTLPARSCAAYPDLAPDHDVTCSVVFQMYDVSYYSDAVGIISWYEADPDSFGGTVLKQGFLLPSK